MTLNGLKTTYRIMCYVYDGRPDRGEVATVEDVGCSPEERDSRFKNVVGRNGNDL